MLLGAVSLLEGEDRGVADAPVLFEGVGPGGEGQERLLAGGQA